MKPLTIYHIIWCIIEAFVIHIIPYHIHVHKLSPTNHHWHHNIMHNRMQQIINSYNKKHVNVQFQIGQLVYYRQKDNDVRPLPIRYINYHNNTIWSIFLEKPDGRLITVSKRNIKPLTPPRPNFQLRHNTTSQLYPQNVTYLFSHFSHFSFQLMVTIQFSLYIILLLYIILFLFTQPPQQRLTKT